jgi:CheY-like chemotaxis protein
MLDFILLIDDDEATNFLHQILAEEAGVSHRIITAMGGEEGIEAMMTELEKSAAPKGLVFLDINMPVTDGWAVVEAYQKMDQSQFSNIRITLISAADQPREPERLKQYPLIGGFSPKPITIDLVQQLAASIQP